MENKQKLIIGAIAAGVLLAGIGIGSNGKNDTPTTSDPKQTTQPAPEPVYTEDDYFLAEVRSSGNAYVDNASDYDLLDVGRQVCTVLDEGYTVLEVAQYLVENGDSNDPDFYEFEGIVVGAAVRNFCPEYEGQIP